MDVNGPVLRKGSVRNGLIRKGDYIYHGDKIITGQVGSASFIMIYEDTAIREAKKLDIPVVAIVDSNTNPEKVEYPIPANDDSIRTIQLIISSLADAIIQTKKSLVESESDSTLNKTVSTSSNPNLPKEEFEEE